MTGTRQRDRAGDPSSDRAHLELLLARVWAAEHALAGEIAEGLQISENAALVLARMRIEETIAGRGRTDHEPVGEGRSEEHYCGRCRALLKPDTVRRAGSGAELFERCVYCGRAAYSGDDWRDAA